jgi:hypothetical protein
MASSGDEFQKMMDSMPPVLLSIAANAVGGTLTIALGTLFYSKALVFMGVDGFWRVFSPFLYFDPNSYLFGGGIEPVFLLATAILLAGSLAVIFTALAGLADTPKPTPQFAFGNTRQQNSAARPKYKGALARSYSLLSRQSRFRTKREESPKLSFPPARFCAMLLIADKFRDYDLAGDEFAAIVILK